MAKKEKQACDVLISGGGIPGLTLSALLAGLGLTVIVVDPNPPAPVKDLKPDGRTAALMAGSVNILKAANLWGKSETYGAPLETLRIIESATARVDFAASDIGQPYFGINMPNAILRSLISGDVTTGEIHAIAADDVGLTATLDNGNVIRTRLLVGADGRDSKTRFLCNIGVWERDYGQRAITCLIDHTKPHENISTEFHRPGGPFTIVPLPGNQSSIVWVEYNEDADTFLKLSRQNFEQALQDRTEGLVGKIILATNPASWPLKALRAKSLVAPRTALIAEAAHVLHPLGAQGLNLSLRDVAALAEEIADAARNGLDIGSHNVLKAYEFRRKADVLTRLFGTDSLNRMVSNDLSLLKTLRGACLKTINAIKPLRDFAMNEGIVPGYDESRLARGEAL
ncbi:MAG: 2-octaprenyl-6-methoxyphenol hydroxylase [Micavibrio sp.]|nr:2-octaprenyl-6-methoxyphenol hydroxylase [Micavibrio sp.]